jgi:class 3 adenylate cyclase
MESACAPGKINLSIKTYELVKEKFNFESRGEIEIKNRAPIAMYYLNTKH